jgi:hypothetical protein
MFARPRQPPWGCPHQHRRATLVSEVDLSLLRRWVLPDSLPPWREPTIASMGFFDDMPAPEPVPPRRHHPWEPPEAEFPGIVPFDALVLARTGQVAVAITGLSAFSNGIEIFLTARIRPVSPSSTCPAGRVTSPHPATPSASACSSPTAARPPGVPAAGQTTMASQPGQCYTRSPAAADRTPSSPGGGPGRCRPPGHWSSSANRRRLTLPNPEPPSPHS